MTSFFASSQSTDQILRTAIMTHDEKARMCGSAHKTFERGQSVFARVGKKAIKGVVVWHFTAANPRNETYTVLLPGEKTARVFSPEELEHVQAQA